MKTKFIFLAALSLGLAGSCKKPEPPVTPMEPTVKYLSKVLLAVNDSVFFEVERCTWDSLNRLETYIAQCSRLPYGFSNLPYGCRFHYDSTGCVLKIDYYGENSMGWCYYLCDWKNEKELNGMDFYQRDIINDTVFHYAFRDIYFYDELNRNVKIERHFCDNTTLIFQIKWEDFNITTAGANYCFVANQKFDDKYSPYNTFPNIFIVGDSNKFTYNTSKNNPVESSNQTKYDYDYDKDGYPLRQYDIQEDGIKRLMYIFEYCE